MTKVRKVKRKKRFRVNVNRKRLRNKLRRLPTIECSQIKKAWDVSQSTRTNLDQMGLAYDANEVLQIPNVKRELVEDAKSKFREDESMSESEGEDIPVEPTKVYVSKELEAEAKAPREKTFRLPNGQVQFLTYLMDKYEEDYKAMVRDKKNYNQLTWRQIRAKINLFKGIPDQYNEYLRTRNV
ncbi:hypothetical protein KM043_006881 [Ampulex compressa]|nr:hypothetical protein KM043_006881 [Ampulex compressa]